MMSDTINQLDHVLGTIKKGDNKQLQKLYTANRKSFGLWAARHYQIDEETISDVYQKTFIAFYYNIKEGKLTALNSSVKTYLYAIGKNIIREQFKSMRKITNQLEVNLSDQELDHSIMEKYDQADLKERIASLLKNIGDPCKTVLELYYFHDYSMESIAVQMNYKTEQIAAKRKFLCLKQMKSMINDN